MSAPRPRYRAVAPLWALLACTLAGAASIGCRGDVSEERPHQFLPDLDDQPKYKPQTESHFFAEYVDEEGNAYGRSMRPPVAGTVAFGRQPYVMPVAGIDFSDRAELLRNDEVVATGRVMTMENGGPVLDANGYPTFTYIERIPIPVTEDLVRLGEKKFNILCMPCHGQTGYGDGMVGSRWAYALPNFHDPKYFHGGDFGQDGYIFHTIRNGLPNPGGKWPLKMPSYARKLTIEETWAVVSYFRALQVHDNATPDMVPASKRNELNRRRSAQAPAAEPSTQEASL